MAVIFGFVAPGQGGLAAGLQVLGRAVAVVGRAPLQQPVDVVVIERQSLRLAIGAFIPVQAQPGHGLQNLGDELFLGALRVRVLNPENKGPVIMPGNEPVEQRRVGAAQMEGAGGAGGESGAHF